MDLRCRACFKLFDEKTGINILTEQPYRTSKGDLSLANMLFECTSVKVSNGFCTCKHLNFLI